jgi:hypothetical protein
MRKRILIILVLCFLSVIVFWLIIRQNGQKIQNEPPEQQEVTSISVALKGLQASFNDLSSQPKTRLEEYLRLVKQISSFCPKISSTDNSAEDFCKQITEVTDYQSKLYGYLTPVFENSINLTELNAIITDLKGLERTLPFADSRINEIISLVQEYDTNNEVELTNKVKFDLLNHRISFWNNFVGLNSLISFAETKGY